MKTKAAAVLILVIFIFLIVFLKFKKQKNQSESLNLVLISIDTLRPDHMGIYGYNKNTTPNIDQWAKNALTFTQAYTVVPETYPSFYTLMTGKYPLAVKIINHIDIGNKITNPVYSNTQTLAKILKNNNFSTSAYLVSAELAPAITHMNQGFDNFHFVYHPDANNKDKEDVVNMATDWIKKNKQKRFFSWIHLIDPHSPYAPPNTYKCTFDAQNCDTILSKTDDQWEALRQKEQTCNADVPSEDKKIFESLYDGEIAFTDSLVKKIFDTLEKNNLSKKTIVVLYSDHGEGFDHSMYFFHKLLYDSHTRVALIIKDPLSSRKGKINTLVQNTDIPQTLLDLLNIPTTIRGSEGIPFSSLIDNFQLIKPSRWKKRDTVISFTNDFDKFSIFDGRYKLIVSSDNSCLFNNQKKELYDIRQDPEETTNIISNYPQQRDNLRIKLLQELSAYNLPIGLDQKYNNDDANKELINQLKALGY